MIKVLHIAAIENNPFNGVCVAAPQHALAQQEFAAVGFINIKNIAVEALAGNSVKQIPFTKPFEIRALPEPFNKPDVVIFHECYRPDYLQIARNLRKYDIPYIVMPHGELGKEAQSKKYLKKKAANILLFNRFTNQALAVQCLSQRELQETNFGKKKILITNGVFIPDTRKTSFHDDRVELIYIGRLDAFHKGLDLMVDAVAKVQEVLRQEKVHIDIYGPDRLGRYEHMESLIDKAGVKDVVHMHHEVAGAEKEKLLLEADAFIQTSRFEGMPLGILEALSYGIPCLVTEGTNLSEKVSVYSAGWSAKTDAEDISRAIVRAIKDRQHYPEYGENGRKFVEKEFSWHTIARNAIDTYENLIASK